MINKTVAVLGAGSWGTAIAIHLAHYGSQVTLWSHNKDHAQAMQAQRCNQKYLPATTFPQTLTAEFNLTNCLQAEYVIIAVPSHAFSAVLLQIKKPVSGLAWLTKGFDPATNQLLSELVTSYWGANYPLAIISGPSFAREVAELQPTALILAANNKTLQRSWQNLLHHHNLRVYSSNDLIGVQLCGAIKNVLAIACGISDGLGYGANARAALITRGLAEMSRLGKAYGAKETTFMGLAGIGDLVLTCTDDQSRNRRFGLLIGKGGSISSVEKQIGQVIEGKNNVNQVCSLARQAKVDMPICLQIESLLNRKITLQQAVSNLITRSVPSENG